MSARDVAADALAFARAALCLAGLHHPGIEAQCAEARGWIVRAADAEGVRIELVSQVLPELNPLHTSTWETCLTYAGAQLVHARWCLPSRDVEAYVEQALRAIDYARHVRSRTSAVQPGGGSHAA